MLLKPSVRGPFTTNVGVPSIPRRDHVAVPSGEARSPASACRSSDLVREGCGATPSSRYNPAMTSAFRTHRPALVAIAAALVCAAFLAPRAAAQPAPPAPSMLLTIFLRHDQSRPLPELNAQL